MSVIAAISLVVVSQSVVARAGAQSPADRAISIAEMRTVDQTYSNVELVSFSLHAGASLRVGRDPVTLPAKDVIRISFAKERHTKAGEIKDFRWTLAGGDRLIGPAISADPGAVVIQDTHVGLISVPLEALARIDVPQPGGAAFRESMTWFDRAPIQGDDLVLLTNGDLLRGFLAEVATDGLILETDAGPSIIPYRLVLSVRFANPESPESKSVQARLELAGGGQVTLSEFRMSDGAASGRTLFGPPVTLEAASIAALEVLGGRWEWLSELNPISTVHVPMLGLAWEHAANASVLGAPLRVAGQSFGRGLGVHSRSTVAYALKGEYREFVTLFGLDESAGALADVDVLVMVDGQAKFSRGAVRAGELFGPIRVDVSGANRLELIVEYGKNGDVQDRFNWIEPGLVRRAD
jgi:hypothetical protein